MQIRTPVLGALAAAGLLAVPAAAQAATTIVGGPLKVKDYSMTLTATDDRAADGLSLMFTRSAGKAMQMHTYSFSDGVKVKARGRSASVKANLGRYGKVKLKLRGAGATKRGVVPRGCTGSPGKVRPGKLAGSFRLVADSTYFRTVSARSLKAQVLKSGKLDCTPTTGGGGGGGGGTGGGATTLTANLDTPEGMLMFIASRAADGGTVQQAMRMDEAAATAPATVMHMISAPGGAAAFAPAADLSSATGSAVTPFFRGAFAFASDTPIGSGAMGTLSGDLVAAFDSIGTQAIAAGSPDAMLMGR